MVLPDWVLLDPRLPGLLERFGASICTPEPVFDGKNWVHITASARVWNPARTYVLKKWSAKHRRWQLPGAHGEGDFDLGLVALREAQLALGLKATPERGRAVEVVLQEVEEYWNTPAHLHLEVVFEFWLTELRELPRDVRWFETNA